jgi:hypothetical protein
LPLFIHRDEHIELRVSVASDKLFHTAAPPRRESTSTPAAALSQHHYRKSFGDARKA